MRPFQHNTGHALEVLLLLIGGAGTVHVGGLLHADIHLTDRQTVTVSVGITHGLGRMPESPVHHTRARASR